MNRVVYRLLKGYLRRSAWLYAVIGALQILMLGAFWSFKYDRVPVVGVMIGFWGAIAAVNTQSLAWRSLPLRPRQANLFRWWAMAGAPGIFLTLMTLIAWASQRSSRFPTPSAATIVGAILATWAALGILVTLARVAEWTTKEFRSARIIAVGALAAIPLLAYGVPVGSGSQPYSIVFIGAGLMLLLVAAERARRGLDWRWPDLANRGSKPAPRRASAWPNHYGLGVILIPLASRSAIFAAIATAIMVALQWMFPRASAALLWAYFIGLSMAGFLQTYQVRLAFQPLRCLPLSAKQLAGWLQLYGSLPGLAALGLTLLVNRVVLNAGLNVGQVASFALVTIASQVFPLPPVTMPQRSKFIRYWVPVIQRLSIPLYIGLMTAGWSEAYSRFPWLKWPVQAGGITLCIIGYFVLVQQLRAGIRPSSNENAFS